MIKSIFSIVPPFCIFLAGEVLGAELVTHCVINATGLQNALSTSGGNNAPDLIKVVQGTYNGNFFYNSSQGYSITLRGGYTAGCAGRVNNPTNTILDGGGAGITVRLENSQGGNVVIEGFTIRNGSGVNSGGGLVASSSSTTVSSDYVTITGNIITGNTSGQNGAGIHAYSQGVTGSGAITIADNEVTDNYANQDGGGISVKTSTTSGTMGAITISNNLVAENAAVVSGGGIYASSISTSGISGAISLDGNNVLGNPAAYNGGIYAYSTGSTGSGAITSRGNTIANNSGAMASGINAHSTADSGTAGEVTFTNNIVTGNSSGKAVDIRSSSPSGPAGTVTCVNNFIAGNTSSTPTGGIYAMSYTTSGTTGAITFTNNTVTGNSGTFTGGADIESFGNSAYVYNNIMWGNTGQDVSVSAATAYGYNNNYSTMGGTWNGGSGGNIDTNPLFVGGGNYRLASDSPCIDTGLNSAPGIHSTDFEGDSRIIDSNFDNIAAVDMGADEFRCPTDPVFNSDTGHYYATPQEAYSAAGDGDTILAQAATFSGPVAFAEDIGVSLKGGYNCGFETVTGFTYFTEGLTIGDGAMTIGNVLIK
jgi:hypothetical protein